MVLDNFKKTSMRIDKANQRFLDYQNAKVGDVNGRELLVQITNNGVVEDQTGTTLKLNWQHENGNQGYTNFNVVDAKTGKYSLYYPKEMLYKGTVDASVEINSNGQITNTMNFKIIVHADVFNGEAGMVDGVFISLADVNKKLDDREKEYVELKERQTSVETQFNSIQQEITDKDIVSAPEIIAARGGLPQLEDRLNETDAQLTQTEGGLASVQNANAKDFLRIENHLGNFENIHPKVINFETAWNGFKYWMAYTPYPQGATEHENPCIAVSNDLINWTVPTGLINPLDPNPVDGYNNDTHLLYRSDTNTIEIWWRYYRESDGKQLFYRRTSTNGVTWTSKELVFTSDLISMVSPCVIFEGGKYKLWAPQGGGIIYMESSGSSVSTWTQPTTLNIDWGELRPWHMDIIRTDIGLEMVVQAYIYGGTNNTADLYYVQGDGNEFTKPKLILAKNVDPQAFDSVGIYRSSLIKEKGMYHLFYSAIGPQLRRAMALSSGRNIFGLNGVTDRNERMLTVSDDSKTELSRQEIIDYDKFRFMGDGITELSIIRGGYEGQRITLIIGKNSRNLKIVLKHNPPYLEMPNGKDFILETSGNFRVTLAVDLICQSANYWRVVGHVPLDTSTMGKAFHAVSAGGTVDELDVSDIDVITLGGAGIEVKSLKGGYRGKVVHFLTTSGAASATIVNSTRLITLGNTNYVFTPAKMGMTAICMNDTSNVWRVF